MYTLFVLALMTAGWLVRRKLMARQKALAPVRVRR